MGLRNPFTIGVSQRTGQLMINDVGEFYFEEVNLGRPGANYGWPMMEGPETREGEEQAAPPDSITSPFYHYEHAAQANSGNLAVVGAAFYEPTTASAPQEYDGEYFFADFGNGWIRRLDLATHAVGEFASGLREGIVDLEMDAQARIYYTIFYGGSVHMIGYAPSQSPSIAQPLADQTAAVGRIATFLVSPWGSAPFEYQWQRDGVDIPGANAASLDIVSDDALDGARFRVVVRNAFGETVSRRRSSWPRMISRLRQ
jgi:hypothetical protein